MNPFSLTSIHHGEAASAALAELQSLNATIREGGIISSTADLDTLIEQALKFHGKPIDVTQWANKLATEVSLFED